VDVADLRQNAQNVLAGLGESDDLISFDRSLLHPVKLLPGMDR